MSPEAEPASPVAAAQEAIPQSLLEDGETIILAIKPSPWWVILNAWPGYEKLRQFMAADFRKDLKNLAIYSWSVRSGLVNSAVIW